MAAPIRPGEEVELRIDSLAYGGNGVGRLDGFVVFVRGGLPGDLVRARATKVKRGFAEATRTALVEPGPDRVPAPCRHFGVCGGCRFQDYAYDRQLASKEAQVRDALERLGRFPEPPLDPIVPAVQEYGYRNKLEYSFSSGEDGLVLGFHRAGRWDEVIDVEECLQPYDQDTGTGYLRHLVVREGRNTGQVLVVLVTAPGERFDADFLVETLTAIPEVRSIHWAVNDRPAEVTNLPTRLLWGEESIEEELCGLRFRIRPNAFLQTNTAMAEVLYGLAREAAGLTGSETVYDLYCGTGTIGLSLAASATSVWGVEISEESVACAIENAALNGIENARFFAGNVGQSLEELAEKAGPPDVVVVDPPRAGLAGKALRRTGALRAPRVVYVSCNPTTLASDLAVLRDDYGYVLERCTPVDMFPHTPHIESVSRLVLPIDRREEQNQDAARQ